MIIMVLLDQQTIQQDNYLVYIQMEQMYFIILMVIYKHKQQLIVTIIIKKYIYKQKII